MICVGNLNLGGGNTVASSIGNATNTPVRVQLRLREAMHEIAYSYCHAMWRNDNYNASADPSEMIVSIPPKYSYLWWQPAIISIDALVYGGLIIGAAAATITIMRVVSSKKKEEGENE